MVKGVLAALDIPSVRRELHGSGSSYNGRARAITIERRSVPLPYPVGLATLQVNGVHLRLVPNKRAGTDGGSSEGKGTRQSGKAVGGEEDAVRVNVVVKVQVRGDLGDSPTQEFIVAVVPLKYGACDSNPNSGGQLSPLRQRGDTSGTSVSPHRHQRQQQKQQTAAKDAAEAVHDKFLSSTGHLPFDKRKLNAMRRAQEQEREQLAAHSAVRGGARGRTTVDDLQGEGGAGIGAPASPPSRPWLSAAVGTEAFASLDLRVQMEHVRVVVELHPMVERVKRPRQDTQQQQQQQQQQHRGRHSGPMQAPSLDCGLEVSVVGTVSLLAVMAAPVSRTHVVDLGSLPREQVIEIAKKQARQIRLKNQRISALMGLIEFVTDGALTKDMIEESISAEAAATERSLVQQRGDHSSNDRKGSSPAHGGGDFSGMGSTAPAASAGYAASLASYFAQARSFGFFGTNSGRDGGGSTKTNNDNDSDSLAEDLQGTVEEERLQFVTRISALEEEVRAKESALSAKVRELAAMQEKMSIWKRKVMDMSAADQARIDALTSELHMLKEGGGGGGSGGRDGAPSSAVRHPSSPLLPPGSGGSLSAAAPLLPLDSQQPTAPPMEEPPASDGVEAELASLRAQVQKLTADNNAIVATLTKGEADASAAVAVAVEAKLGVWRKRFRDVLEELQRQHEALESQLAATQAELARSHAAAASVEQAARSTTAQPSNVLEALFGTSSDDPAPVVPPASLEAQTHLSDDDTATYKAKLAELQDHVNRLTDENAQLRLSLQAQREQTRPDTPSHRLSGESNALTAQEMMSTQQWEAARAELTALRERLAASELRAGELEQSSADADALREKLRGMEAEAVEQREVTGRLEAAAKEQMERAELLESELARVKEELSAAAERETSAAATASVEKPCEQCVALQTKLAEWKAKAKDVIAEAQAAREALEGEVTTLHTTLAERDALLETQSTAVEAGTAELTALREQLAASELRAGELERAVAGAGAGAAQEGGPPRDSEVTADERVDMLARNLLMIEARVTELSQALSESKEENSRLHHRNERLLHFKSEVIAELRRSGVL